MIQFNNVLDFGIFLRGRTEFLNNSSLQEIANGTNRVFNGCNCSVKTLVNSLEVVYRKLGEVLTEEDKTNMKTILNTNEIIISSGQTLIVRF